MSKTPRTLKDYLRHDADCDSRFVTIDGYDQTCTCGLDALLSAPDADPDAPELLTALKEVTAWLKAQRDYELGNALPEEYAAVEQAEAVIAKAEVRDE